MRRQQWAKIIFASVFFAQAGLMRRSARITIALQSGVRINILAIRSCTICSNPLSPTIFCAVREARCFIQQATYC
jgi:hypothetical protein